jgi:hypothetical protein
MTLAPWLIVAVLVAGPATAAEQAPGEALARELRVEIALRNEAFAREPANIADKDWVKRKLAHMWALDQYVRRRTLEAINPPGELFAVSQIPDECIQVVVDMDRAHRAELKELLRHHRWFPASEFGSDASDHAILIAIHADMDVDFQRQVLKLVEPLARRGEIRPMNYANLFDRVAMAEKRPQRYGTQGNCAEDKTWTPFALEEPNMVDSRRAQLDLESVADTVRTMSDVFCR